MVVVFLEFTSAMRINEGDSLLVEILGKCPIPVLRNLLACFDFRGDDLNVSDFVTFVAISVNGVYGGEDFVKVDKLVREDVVPNPVWNGRAVWMADKQVLDIGEVLQVVLLEEESCFEV